jgi:hypothetical protein
MLMLEPDNGLIGDQVNEEPSTAILLNSKISPSDNGSAAGVGSATVVNDVSLKTSPGTKNANTKVLTVINDESSVDADGYKTIAIFDDKRKSMEPNYLVPILTSMKPSTGNGKGGKTSIETQLSAAVDVSSPMERRSNQPGLGPGWRSMKDKTTNPVVTILTTNSTNPKPEVTSPKITRKGVSG